jgi:tellurite methyltransferase
MSISNEEADPQDVWRRYFAATDARPVHAIFDSIEPLLPDSGTAIDLGCGAGRGTIWLLEHGLHVVAVDIAQEALDYLRAKLPAKADVELVRSSFEGLDLTAYPLFDVSIACFTLFFLSPEEFSEFWPRVVDSIKPGGVFAGQFLGVNDTWAERGFTVHRKEEVERLLGSFETLLFKEEEQDGETAIGEHKHWHVFHVIARKR